MGRKMLAVGAVGNRVLRGFPSSLWARSLRPWGAFKLLMRHNRLTAPTQLAETIFRAAEPLMVREIQEKTFRLIGVGVDTLTEESLVGQGDLFAASHQSDEAHHAEVERAMDAVRAKFGRRAIRKGRADA